VQAVVEQADVAVEPTTSIRARCWNGCKLMTVRDVAHELQCSPRTVYRLADAGRMPPPVRLGSLVRWSRQAIDAWIVAGCPNCRR
jgi:excisionase family DNA binding protein